MDGALERTLKGEDEDEEEGGAGSLRGCGLTMLELAGGLDAREASAVVTACEPGLR